MKKVSGIVLLLVVLVVPVVAQDAQNAAKPSREDVLKLMDLMQSRARMEQVLDGMKQAMKRGAEAGLRQRIANPTPDQLAAADAIADFIFKDIPVEEMFESLIPIYQKHLTKSDLDALVGFYSSPVGQRFLKEMPAIMTESMQAGQDIMIQKIPELTDRMNTKIAELADQELKKSNSGQQPATK